MAILSAGVVAATPRAASVRAPVGVDAIVLDANQAPVSGLTRDDFEVLVDGAAAAIETFAIAPPELAVVLLVDNTASQPLRRTEILNAIAVQWIPSLIHGDRARLAVLANPVTLGPWLVPGRPADIAGVRALLDRSGAEPSPIWDALDASMRALDDERGARAILLLSDGRATANRLGLEDVAARAVAAGVSIASISEGGEIVVPQGADPAARIRPDASLEWLAGETGGLFFEDGVARRTTRARGDPFAYVRELMRTPNQPGLLLARAMSALRARYRLTIDAPADGRAHRLEVRVRRPGLTVRARRGFTGL